MANQDHFWGNTHFRAITGRDKVELLKETGSGAVILACGVCGKVGCRHQKKSLNKEGTVTAPLFKENHHWNAKYYIL